MSILNRFRISAQMFLLCALFVILCGSWWGLRPRLAFEKENLNFAVVVDWRDVQSMAQNASVHPLAALRILKEKGLGSLMVSEYTGDDLLLGASVIKLVPDGAGGQGSLLSIPASYPYAKNLSDILANRANAIRAGIRPTVTDDAITILYPSPIDAIRKTGIVPDLEGLEAGKLAGLPIFYRPAGAGAGHLGAFSQVLKRVLSDYPGIALVAPSGEIAPGYPDMKPLADILRAHKVPYAEIEFSRQLGAASLNWLMFPSIIPLHSVTNEELLARNINRDAMMERLVRAAVERGVRLLVLRPAVSGGAEPVLEDFALEVQKLVAALSSRGLVASWPTPVALSRPSGVSFFSTLACAAAFLLSLTRYLKRFFGPRGEPFQMMPQEWPEVVFFVGVTLLITIAARYVVTINRFLGAFTAALVVTESALLAMGDAKRGWRAILSGFLYAIVGGLSVAALFSESLYMLRLLTFSGVKLTLMLPPVLIVLHDMKRRIHPESLSEFLSRPPLWGEFFLGLLLLMLLGIALFRSDNVQFIPGIEARIRDWLERVLVARPRNREVFVGYPSLVLYIFAVNNRLWHKYREILRVGVVIGFSSVVNSFCHYHTPLVFTLLREFHGLWTGLLIGFFAVVAMRSFVLPAWNKARFIFN
ncbi:hypothetical protein AGMMS50276_27030 [Synergistales bacterium]|nr:hypothetical protein AGMMS50276_27030 [Synergistales bacterium]